MACGTCGGKNRFKAGNWQTEPWVDATLTNRAMAMTVGDSEDCTPYHGRWMGTNVHIVDQGGDFEQIFLKRDRRIAVAYAREHSVNVTRPINVTRLCHDVVVKFLGE
jgi:hypothetical protein